MIIIIILLYFIIFNNSFQEEIQQKINNEIICNNNEKENEILNFKDPVFLTNMCNGIYLIDYLISDQCIQRQDYDNVESYSLHFHNNKGYSCDRNGLIICFPSQLDGNNKQSGITSTIKYRILNLNKNIIAEKCEIYRKRLCQKEKNMEKINLCKIGGPGNSIWHGIQLKTNKSNNNSFILGLSVTNRKYNIDNIEDFFIEFGSKENVFTKIVTRSDKENKKINKIDELLRNEFLEKAHLGAYLLNYTGIWTLGIDLLPTLAKQKIHLFVYRGCSCSIDAWFKRPYNNNPRPSSIIGIGSKQCPAKHIEKNIIKLNGFGERKSIIIKLTTDKYAKRAEFALQNKNGNNILDIYINNNSISFGPGNAEGHWYPTKIVFLSEKEKILVFGKEIKITIQAFKYHLIILINNFKKMVSTFWPFFWWKQMPYNLINYIAIAGDFALLRSIEIVDFNNTEHIPCPFSFHLNQVIKNKTRIVFRGIVHQNVKRISFTLLHDATKWHKYLGATVMRLHVNFNKNSINWLSYYGSEVQILRNISKIIGFKRGQPFELIIVVTDHSIKDSGIINSKYSAFVNGEFIGKAFGKLPLWTINWIRVNGQMTLLQEPVVDYYLCGETSNFYKLQLKHLPYYGSRYCLEGTVLPFNEMSERKGFEINFFHEATEFDENIGDTVLKMNFIFDIQNASNDILLLNSYQHNNKFWDKNEIHPNPIGRSGVTFDIRIYINSFKFQISINNGIDLINYKYRLPPWAANYITVNGDIKDVYFDNESNRCKKYYKEENETEREEHPFPKNIYQVNPDHPLNPGDLISIQGIVKLSEKVNENGINISISFYHEALDWHFIVGRTIFQANFTENKVSFNTYLEDWKFNKSNEPNFKIIPPLIIGHLFNLEVIINKKELKIHYGRIQEMTYLLNEIPPWTIQYIKVDSEALSLPPRGNYVKIERGINEEM